LHFDSWIAASNFKERSFIKQLHIYRQESIMQSDEKFTFDKFMDDIITKEASHKPKLAEETPQRNYAKKYAERAINRIKYIEVK